ncbi:MAG: hypothetical protein WKG07_30610 [Hymenobacter sp.]
MKHFFSLLALASRQPAYQCRTRPKLPPLPLRLGVPTQRNRDTGRHHARAAPGGGRSALGADSVFRFSRRTSRGSPAWPTRGAGG